MKKKTPYILIALMCFALTGIVWVQVYWIKNGVKVKESQFNQLVYQSMNAIVGAFENNESVYFIQKQLNDSVVNVLHKDSTKKKRVLKKWVNQHISVDVSGTKEAAFNYTIATDNEVDEVAMEININGTQQKVGKIDNLEDLAVIIDSTKLLFSTPNEKVIGNRFENVIIKMVNEFKDIKEPVAHLLKDLDVELIIKTKLNDNGISIPFSYAIINNEAVVDSFSSKHFNLTNESYTVKLFKHNIFENKALLALNFSGKNQHILKSMWVMVVSSIVFTLIIMLTFFSTIYYMLKQKKVAEMKNDFINNMTHEFKTPISTISLAIDAITHPKIIKNENQINHFANVIRKENTRMNQQIESVLNTALGEKNELELKFMSIDLNTIIQAAAERMKLQLKAHNAILKLHLSKKSLNVLVDNIHFQNAICNLIDNAIKYNKEEPVVILKTDLDKGVCMVSVSDNGIGMSHETQKKVFEKFYRVEKGNIHTTKGFGIGLSYVKTVVAAHKGTIDLKSKLNKGTTVLIKIPQA